jgi:hypothetical protein
MLELESRRAESVMTPVLQEYFLSYRFFALLRAPWVALDHASNVIPCASGSSRE